MKLDYTQEGKVIIDMKDYVDKDMLQEFPQQQLADPAASPANKNLFKINDHSPKLSEIQKNNFHTRVAKGLFLCKQVRQEIQTAIAFLCTQVRDNPRGLE